MSELDRTITEYTEQKKQYDVAYNRLINSAKEDIVKRSNEAAKGILSELITEPIEFAVPSEFGGGKMNIYTNE